MQNFKAKPPSKSKLSKVESINFVSLWKKILYHGCFSESFIKTYGRKQKTCFFTYQRFCPYTERYWSKNTFSLAYFKQCYDQLFLWTTICDNIWRQPKFISKMFELAGKLKWEQKSLMLIAKRKMLLFSWSSWRYMIKKLTYHLVLLHHMHGDIFDWQLI